MTAGRDHRVFWLGALIGSIALVTLPMFTKASMFAPIEVGAGALLMVVALLGLRRPRRIRLPRKRTFS
jgi:MYXO-CTERM domain-containing protein